MLRIAHLKKAAIALSTTMLAAPGTLLAQDVKLPPTLTFTA
jgi:hypothetical protein